MTLEILKKTGLLVVMVALLSAGFVACDDDPAECDDCKECKDDAGVVFDPCGNVDCGGNGQCVVADDKAMCLCDEGYEANGLTCKEIPARDVCEGVTCSEFGDCNGDKGYPVCECDQGYYANGTDCLEVIETCADLECNDAECINVQAVPTCICDYEEIWDDVEESCVSVVPACTSGENPAIKQLILPEGTGVVAGDGIGIVLSAGFDSKLQMLVRFNDEVAPITAISSGAVAGEFVLYVKVPAGVEGSVQITVANGCTEDATAMVAVDAAE